MTEGVREASKAQNNLDFMDLIQLNTCYVTVFEFLQVEAGCGKENGLGVISLRSLAVADFTRLLLQRLKNHIRICFHCSGGWPNTSHMAELLQRRLSYKLEWYSVPELLFHWQTSAWSCNPHVLADLVTGFQSSNSQIAEFNVWVWRQEKYWRHQHIGEILGADSITALLVNLLAGYGKMLSNTYRAGVWCFRQWDPGGSGIFHLAIYMRQQGTTPISKGQSEFCKCYPGGICCDVLQSHMAVFLQREQSYKLQWDHREFWLSSIFQKVVAEKSHKKWVYMCQKQQAEEGGQGNASGRQFCMFFQQWDKDRIQIRSSRKKLSSAFIAYFSCYSSLGKMFPNIYYAWILCFQPWDPGGICFDCHLLICGIAVHFVACIQSFTLRTR